jgi:hypothetical protein
MNNFLKAIITKHTVTNVIAEPTIAIPTYKKNLLTFGPAQSRKSNSHLIGARRALKGRVTMSVRTEAVGEPELHTA